MNRNVAARAGVVGKVGPALRTLRERAGVSQADLARRAGVGVSTLSRIEGGVQKPSLEHLARLAGGLGLDIVGLLTAMKRKPAA